jgi:hypothetical protein
MFKREKEFLKRPDVIEYIGNSKIKKLLVILLIIFVEIIVGILTLTIIWLLSLLFRRK